MNPAFENEMAEILESFIVESNEIVEKLGQDLLALEKEPKNPELHNVIFRAVHTVKGTSSFLGFEQMTSLAHRFEDVLNKVRKGDLVVTAPTMDVLFEAYDLLKDLLQRIERKEAEPVDLEGILAKLEAVASGAVVPAAESVPVQPVPVAAEAVIFEEETGPTETAPAAGMVPAPAPSIPSASNDHAVHAQTAQPARVADATIRVDVARLDVLMNLVGELVLGRNRLSQISHQMNGQDENVPLARELSETNAHIDFITTELQMAVMKTRMVPIAKVFNKIPRMVRELAKEMKKEIELVVTGEETELDKSLIEEINDPLVHLIRNAADHGIETPDRRLAAGKPAKGTITVRAQHEGNHITISVQDDGQGMDPEVLKQKAIEKGLITSAQAAEMSARDAYNLVFLPGFSTAKVVTNVSGRGVGMDVVRTNVQNLKGTIEIDSALGAGSTFIIRLPLTLAIQQTLLVEVGKEIFSVPLDAVVEVVRIRTGDVETVNGMEVIRLRDSVLPLARLVEVLDGHRNGHQAEWLYVVVVGLAERRLGLVVDALLGQKEVVIKSIGEYLGTVRGVAGSTILGDGRVIMIVDVGELMRMCAGRN